jgi:hypothetical protein
VLAAVPIPRNRKLECVLQSTWFLALHDALAFENCCLQNKLLVVLFHLFEAVFPPGTLNATSWPLRWNASQAKIMKTTKSISPESSVKMEPAQSCGWTFTIRK